MVWIWDINSVYTHPCDSSGYPELVGPTVADLANTLAAQPLREGTAPAPVTVGGYDGLYVELSMPDDIDVDACPGGQFLSWPGRNQQGPTQVDLLWIVDVEGQRLTFDLSYDATASREQADELREIVETATFAPRDGATDTASMLQNPNKEGSWNYALAQHYVLALESIGAEADEPKDKYGTLDALGPSADEMRRYEDVGGLSVWSGESRDGTTCLLVAHPDQGLRNGIGAEGCSPEGLDPSLTWGRFAPGAPSPRESSRACPAAASSGSRSRATTSTSTCSRSCGPTTRPRRTASGAPRH